MQGYNFTERVRKALAAARADAERRGHAMVTPEHIALGLVQDDTTVAQAVLRHGGVDVPDLRHALEARLPSAAEDHSAMRDY